MIGLKKDDMLPDNELDNLRDKLRPVILELAEKMLPNQSIRIEYEVGSITFDFWCELIGAE